MKKIRILSGILFAAVCSLFVTGCLSQPPKRTITVTAMSITQKEKRIGITIDCRATDIETARRKCDEASERAKGILKELGVPEKNITDTFTSSQKIDWQNVGEEKFMANRNFEIIVGNDTDIDALTRRLTEAGVTGFHQQPMFLDPGNGEAFTLEEALTLAKEKAGRIAEKINCSVGKPVTIEELGSPFGPGGTTDVMLRITYELICP